MICERLLTADKAFRSSTLTLPDVSWPVKPAGPVLNFKVFFKRPSGDALAGPVLARHRTDRARRVGGVLLGGARFRQ